MPYNYDYLLLLTLQGGDDLLAGGWPHDVAAFRNLGEGVVTIAGVTVVTTVATVATVIIIVLIVVVFFLVLIVILLLALGVRTTEARMIEAPDHGLLLLVVLVGVGVAQVFLWCLLFSGGCVATGEKGKPRDLAIWRYSSFFSLDLGR